MMSIRLWLQIYILLYKELALALKINSVYSKRKLLSIHENVRVLRYPDHFSAGVYLCGGTMPRSYIFRINVVNNRICNKFVTYREIKHHMRKQFHYLCLSNIWCYMGRSKEIELESKNVEESKKDGIPFLQDHLYKIFPYFCIKRPRS
ncbi:hypothetical protein V6N13_123144 [Hibiscus sabdariffa]